MRDTGELQTTVLRSSIGVVRSRRSRVGRLLAKGLAVSALAAVALTGWQARDATGQGRGTVVLVKRGVIEDVKSLKDFCRPERILKILGPPLPDIEDIPAPVRGYALQFNVTVDASGARESFYVGIYSFMSIEFVVNRTHELLAQLQIPPDKARLSNYVPCQPVFTRASAGGSQPHASLFAVQRVRTLLGVDEEIVPVAAMYFAYGKGSSGGPATPPPVADGRPKTIPPAPTPGPLAGAPPGALTGKAKDKDVPGPSAALPTPAPGAPPGPPVAAVPPVAGPDRPPAALATPPAKAPPPVAGPSVPSVPPRPPAQVGPSDAEEEEKCQRGDAVACMIVSKRKAAAARAAAAPEPPKTPAKVADAAPPALPAPTPAPAPAPPPAAKEPPAVKEPPVKDGAAPVPPTAAAPKGDADATTGPKPIKRYPPPAYATMSEPLGPARPGEQRLVFVVEQVECSDEGNWIIGYMGYLAATADAVAGEVSVRQRYAINNYPEEGRSTLAALKATPGVECSPDGVECSVPRRRITLAEFNRMKAEEPPPAAASEPADKSKAAAPGNDGGQSKAQWRCKAAEGACYSVVRNNWRCDGQGGACMSYDAARWWCVPRREFCSQRVPFGDWGSLIKEGDRLRVTLVPRKDAKGEIEKDAAGHAVYDHHVYDMSHGLIPIARDALQRRCGGYAGPAREWKAEFRVN